MIFSYVKCANTNKNRQIQHILDTVDSIDILVKQGRVLPVSGFFLLLCIQIHSKIWFVRKKSMNPNQQNPPYASRTKYHMMKSLAYLQNMYIYIISIFFLRVIRQAAVPLWCELISSNIQPTSLGCGQQLLMQPLQAKISEIYLLC